VIDRRQPSIEKPRDPIEADPSQAKGRLCLGAGISDDDDRSRGVEQCAGPCCVLPAEPDVDAAGQVGRGKFRRVPGVEQLRALVDGDGRLFDCQRFQFARERLIERRPLTAVQHGVVGEVRRCVGLIRRYQLDEAFLRHRLQRVIEPPLIADCGHRLFRHRLAAERAGTVRGVDACRVGQLQQLVVQRVVEHGAEFARRPAERRAEIRSSHIADKQCVARKHGHGRR